MTQYGSRRLMDDFVKQIGAVGFEGLDMFDFQIYGLIQMFGSIEKYQEYLQDHGIAKIVNLFRGIMYDPGSPTRRAGNPRRDRGEHPADARDVGEPADREPHRPHLLLC
jgi:hypothetical protein